jgi:hypothetical protein
LIVPCPQHLATLGYLRPALLELLELYDPRLVGVHESCLLPREALQVSLELLRLGVLFVVACRAGVGELLELAQESLRISH